MQLTGLTLGRSGRREVRRRLPRDRGRSGATRSPLAAGDRDPELSVFVQRVDVDDPKAAIAATSDRIGVPPDVVEESPYFGYASVDALVDRLIALREESGLSYYTVHEVDEFSPVVARLAGT